MGTTGSIDDLDIEAIIRGEPVEPDHAPLAAFAQEVRALGDGPAPRASSELAALLDNGLGPRAALRAVPTADVAERAERGVRAAAHRRPPASGRLAVLTGKVAGLGVVAKIGLGATLAAAGVAGAGAAGVLPPAANDAVRGAIEVVSPVEFNHPGTTENPATFGHRVSPDATGAADGQPGVDGPATAGDAPGTAPGQAPGQTGETGLDRAHETPAAGNVPDSVPSTVPERGRPEDAGSGQTPSSVPNTAPSTVPAGQGAQGDE
ncbi:MAG TPA: hypothetical protein VFI47_10970 [Acidimicrobiales bacterium]|nr:hypothetical protein [Acidimicrobiales bacterium]